MNLPRGPRGLILASLLLAAPAAGDGYGRAGSPPLNGCGPAYLAMEPDGITYGFPVTVIRLGGPASVWTYTFQFPSRARCDEAWGVVKDVLQRVHDRGASITVGECS